MSSWSSGSKCFARNHSVRFSRTGTRVQPQVRASLAGAKTAGLRQVADAQVFLCGTGQPMAPQPTLAEGSVHLDTGNG